MGKQLLSFCPRNCSSIAEIFRDKKNLPFRLYQHQQAAIEKAKPNISSLPAGLSGKPLLFYSYCDFIAQQQIASDRVTAIVYPMNSANPQYESLKRLSQIISREPVMSFLFVLKIYGHEGKKPKTYPEKSHIFY